MCYGASVSQTVGVDLRVFESLIATTANVFPVRDKTWRTMPFSLLAKN